jgi:hypothetical protein
MNESKPHLLDLKLPLGGLLFFYGLVLTVYGLASDPATYEKSFGLNINLAWGLLMLIVGGIFAFVHFRKKS